jgi:TolB-like protein/DNA-binding winged helix-turn-helix (wHTH) protein/tetratricopeptide (TPR) repeat protein
MKKGSYRFGDFVLDVSEHRLKRGEQEIYLRPRSFEALVYLIERHGRLVEKNELLDALWPDTVVTENALTQSIKELRQALDDDAHHPRYVLTIPRVGYKFIAKVEAVSSVAVTEEVEEEYATISVSLTEEGPEIEGAPERRSIELVTPSPLHLPTPSRLFLRWWRRPRTVLLVAASLVLLVLGGLYAFRQRSQSIDSVAVLPFANLSADPTQAYFTDGLTEALITDLGRIRALRVISRTSVMQYKDTRKPLSQIARELNVDALVEGSVLRSGQRVRITAKLIHASTGQLLWADRYERDLRDILALQGQVTQAIARRINITLTPQQQARLSTPRPVTPELYEAYLKGRFHWKRRTPADLQKSVDYFQQAIDLDPTYAEAYAGLAASYHLMGSFVYDVLPPDEVYPRIREAIRKALELDEQQSEALVILGETREEYEWDWRGAERAYQQSLEINPNNVEAHHFYTSYLARMGRLSEALAAGRRAETLDPLSLVVKTNVARVLYYARQYHKALEEVRQTLELEPNFFLAHLLLGYIYYAQGMYQEAHEAYQKAITLVGRQPVVLMLLGALYPQLGKPDEARKILEELQALSHQRYVRPSYIAMIHVSLGEHEQAFAWLEKAYAERDSYLPLINVDPFFDPLRPDPRFHDLLRRMRLRTE